MNLTKTKRENGSIKSALYPIVSRTRLVRWYPCRPLPKGLEEYVGPSPVATPLMVPSAAKYGNAHRVLLKEHDGTYHTLDDQERTFFDDLTHKEWAQFVKSDMRDCCPEISALLHPHGCWVTGVEAQEKDFRVPALVPMDLYCDQICQSSASPGRSAMAQRDIQ